MLLPMVPGAGGRALGCSAVGCGAVLPRPSTGLDAALAGWLSVAGRGCGLGIWLGPVRAGSGRSAWRLPECGAVWSGQPSPGGRWRSGLRGHGSHFRLLLLVSGARSLPERTCNRTFACKDASACFVPLVSWSSWGVLREAFLTGSSAGASFQAVVGWEAYPKLSDAT